MTLIISIIAVFVAFGALILGSMAIKKTEHEITEFANVVRRDFAAVRGDVDAKLAAIDKKMEKLERRVDQARETEAETRRMFNEVSRDLAVLRDSVTELEASLPPQFRRRNHMAENQINN